VVLLALTGAHADHGRGELGFAPVLEASTDAEEYRTFWSSGKAWGIYRQRRDESGAWQPSVDVLGGDATGLRATACGRSWALGET
jgi:hypothetical protein